MRAAFLRGFRNTKIRHVPGQREESVEGVQPSSAAITRPSGATTADQFSDANGWMPQLAERVNGERIERVRHGTARDTQPQRPHREASVLRQGILPGLPPRVVVPLAEWKYSSGSIHLRPVPGTRGVPAVGARSRRAPRRVGWQERTATSAHEIYMTWAGSARKDRLPGNWSIVRLQILQRDRGICYVCHREGADQVDHLVPGDDHRASNLAAIHNHPCHARKSSSEGGSANARKWRRQTAPHPGLL
jgi:5-methylcytosine-specific restriction protein A